MTADQKRRWPPIPIENLRASAYVIRGNPRPRVLVKPVLVTSSTR